MEKTVSTPFWTGMTLFTINRQKGGRRHLLRERMYQASKRVAFKGQVFSAPMDWNNVLQQLDDMDQNETQIVLPKLGAVLASEVRISIEAGLVSLQGYLREATVRRNVVAQLISMFKDAGHPNYTRVNMADVKIRAAQLTDTDEAAIPNDLADMLAESDSDSDDGGADKAATPAERLHSIEEFQKHVERARPQLMFFAT